MIVFLRLGGVVPGDGGDAIKSVWNLGDAALPPPTWTMPFTVSLLARCWTAFSNSGSFWRMNLVKLRGLHSRPPASAEMAVRRPRSDAAGCLR